jgi:LCP family protein required for cell wall assembly
MRRPHRSWRQRVLLGTGIVVVVLALLGVGGVLYFVKALGNIDRTDVNVDAARAGEPRNYLLVGSDVRSNGEGGVEGRRSDTIMVVRLDPGTLQASVLSFPRDLVVTIAGSGEEGRINAAYAQSQQTLIDTLRENFGIEINHYIEIDFQGFQQLVDAIGGVNIWVQDAIRDRQSGLFIQDRGCVTLNGEQALAFARSRELQFMTPDGWSNPDPFADLGRIDRQQVFMRRALAKAIRAARSNPLELRDIISIGTGSVTIDNDTDPLQLFDQFRDFDLNNLVTYSLPVITYDDRATVDVDRAAAGPILGVFRGLEPGEVTPESITVRVLNSTGEEGQANNAARAFQTIGFQISEPGNIQEPHERTTVYHRTGEEAFAQRVARHISGGADVTPREDLEIQPGEVVVVTGNDFSTIHMQPAPADSVASSSTSVAAGGAAPAPAPSSTSTTAAESPTTSAPERPPPQAANPMQEYVVGDPPPGHECN